MNVIGYNISVYPPEWPFIKQTVINTLNPHSYCVAKKDCLFRKALQQADFLIPDGSGIVLAARFLEREKIRKIAGADMHKILLKEAHNNSLKVFYLGSNQATLNKISIRIKKEFPNVMVDTFSPPYKDEFSSIENSQMLEAVNQSSPDILFVGMTAPKQEKWVYQNKERLDAKAIASIGAVFDFYAGTIKRPGIFWISLGLEWFPRLLREPKRLWRRNFISIPCFLWDVFKAKMGWLHPAASQNSQ